MSNATKCDRCGGFYEQGGKAIRQGFGSDMEEFDLCPDCAKSFDAWLERGQMADTSERVTESTEMSHDTREKLETAAQTAAGYIYGRGFTNGLVDAWNDDEVDTAANQIIQLLDRQAAITEREVKLRELYKFEENHRWHVRSIEEVNQQLNERIKELEEKMRRQAESIGEWELSCESLEVERDKLQREIATLKEHRAANVEKLHGLTDECAELRKYRDEWRGLAEKYRTDSIAAQEECERYRAKLGDVLDAIHEAERAAR